MMKHVMSSAKRGVKWSVKWVNGHVDAQCPSSSSRMGMERKTAELGRSKDVR